MCSNVSRGQRFVQQRGPLGRHGGSGSPSPLPAAARTVWRPGGALPPTPPAAEQFHRLRKLSLQLPPRLRHILLGGWTGWESPHIVAAVVWVWTWGLGACRQCSSHDWWAGTLQESFFYYYYYSTVHWCLSLVGQGACNNVWGIMWFWTTWGAEMWVISPYSASRSDIVCLLLPVSVDLFIFLHWLTDGFSLGSGLQQLVICGTLWRQYT